MWQTILGLGFFFAILLGGFFTAWIAQNILVPLIVQAIGANKFAETSAFDGCTLPIAGAVGSMILFVVLESLWLIFPIVALCITAYGLIWLLVLGSGAGGKEWKVEAGRIARLKTEEELNPLFVWQKQDYHQTDAYSGYSHYFLELHNENGMLAKNGYRSEQNKDADLAALFEAAPQCRALSLYLAWRVEPRRWGIFQFFDEWTPLLCGPLTEIPEASRGWWRQWTYPRFGGEIEIPIDIEDWLYHLDELQSAYPSWPNDLLPETPPNDFIDSLPSARNSFTRLKALLDEAKGSEIPVLAMTFNQFYSSARAACGENDQIIHNLANHFMELRPLK